MPYIRHPIWDHQIGAGMTVTKAIGGACLLYALVYMPHRRGGPPRYFATPQSKLMMVFFGIAAVSFFTKGQAIGYINPMFMYASTVLMFFLTLTVIDSFYRLYWSLMVAIGSVGFASLYMIREWQHGVLVWGGGFRPGWIVGDSNYFTVAALVTLPIAFELILISKRKWQRVYALGCLGLTLMAITLGASRGGFLGIMVNLVYLVSRAPKKGRNLALITLVVVPFMIFAPNSPIHRLLHPVASDAQSVQFHILGWKAGLNMVVHHPVFGVGLGNYKLVVGDYDTSGVVKADPHVAHNAYLEVAAEMGVPALGVYLLLFTTTFLSVGKNRKIAIRRGANDLATICLAIQAALLGVWVAIFFVSAEYTRLFWFMMCITMALPGVLPRKSAEQQKQPPARGGRVPTEPQPEPEPAFQTGEALIGLR